jgi:hypothetical protein
VNLNPPRRVRAALYVLTAVGTPVAAYLKFKGLIGDAELALWGAEVTVVNGLAALNTGSIEEGN